MIVQGSRTYTSPRASEHGIEASGPDRGLKWGGVDVEMGWKTAVPHPPITRLLLGDVSSRPGLCVRWAS